MKVNKLNLKNVPNSIEYLNDAVLGIDPETKVLSRLYEGDEPLQDRVSTLEDGQTDLEETIQQIEAVVDNKADMFTLTNLVPNGDLLIPYPSIPDIPKGFSSSLTTDRSLSDGIFTFTPTAKYGAFTHPNNGSAVIGDVYYLFAYVKSSSNDTILTGYGYAVNINKRHSGNGQWELLSSAGTKTNTDNGTAVYFNGTSGFTPIEVDYMGVINLTDIFGRGKEPTAAQMDKILRYTGYFQSTKLNLIDIFMML